jgi:hypothetical protein
MKRVKKGPKIVETLHELKLLCVSNMAPLRLMPPAGTTVVAEQVAAVVGYTSGKAIHIPMECATYNTEGLCLTGPMQLKWMEQLLDHPREFVLHVDGKHKLHHGGWVLMTIGFHRLRWDPANQKLSTTFVPLVYQMCRQVESGTASELGSAHMLVDALNVVCLKALGKCLEPGAGISDHCAAYRNAYERAFPDMPFGQCYPHIMMKLDKGEYCKVTFAHFEEAKEHVRAIHLAVSVQMKELLIEMIGDVWDEWGDQGLRTKFWNSYCVEPWDCWSVGLFENPLCTPSNNTQEAWHRDLLRSRIPGHFRGSTECVFNVALPKLIDMDALLQPSILTFDVPAIPAKMMQKALFYITNQKTHVHSFDLEGEPAYYVLSETKAAGAKCITKRIIEMFTRAMIGELDARIKDVPSLMQVCQSMHLVCKPAEGMTVYECDGNRGKYDCVACKGFKGVGICSHVLAINHITKQYNVRYELSMLQTRSSKKAAIKGGNVKRVAPALTRAPVAAPDSSDEEEAELLRLGEQGK